MTELQLSRAIFTKWKAELFAKDASERSREHVQSNFEELFYAFSSASIPFEVANDFIKEAVTAHMPQRMIAEIVYKRVKTSSPDLTKAEFIAQWREDIENSANAAFYTFYDIPGTPEVKTQTTGGMSPQEYSLQRRHANSFPTVTIEELNDIERRRKQFMEEESEDFTFDF
jgi:hypothetical protein